MQLGARMGWQDELDLGYLIIYQKPGMFFFIQYR